MPAIEHAPALLWSGEIKFLQGVVVLTEVAAPAARHEIAIGIVCVDCEWFDVVKRQRNCQPDTVIVAV